MTEKNAVEKRGRGRPAGSVSQRTKAMRDITNEAILDGITPVEVMLENMRFYHEKADVLLTAIVAGVKGNKKSMELLAALKELGSFKDKAQTCAVDAAPYCHPRLSATNVSGEITHKVEEAQEAFKTIAGVLDAAVNGDPIDVTPKKKTKVSA